MHAIGTMVDELAVFGTDPYCLESLSRSMIVEEIEVETVVARVFDYDDLVLQGKALYESDIARFDCPDLDDPRMLWGSAEYFRWYTADEKKREAPLDADELIQLFCNRGLSAEDAEREVYLNSRAKQGDKAMWDMVVQLGYKDWTRAFAQEEYGFL
ncbi:hypothetical protein ACHMW6_00110 (plasmid) [Pseudoduganella sp. UC29_106]|uniref:hypothetical protein n=1 Tax=Pseudoduganella sp. UC29_106 TaxID=3374553 RepID=UPI003756379D